MRARSLKPGFFKNEDLGTADPLYGIVYQGLWCLADREGRLEDRPLRIHAEVNPYRHQSSTVQALEWLRAHSFIARYKVNGVAYIAIPAFEDHQHPHVNEKPSEISGPEKADTDQLDVIAPDSHGASTVQAPESHQSTPSDSGLLTPSSLTPDCLSSSQHGANGRIATEQGKGEAHQTRGSRVRARGTATRLPADFALTDERRATAVLENLDPERTFAKFTDYWRATSGANARKLDWDATWRNWCRNDADRGGKTVRAPPARLRTADEVEAEERARARGGARA